MIYQWTMFSQYSYLRMLLEETAISNRNSPINVLLIGWFIQLWRFYTSLNSTTRRVLPESAIESQDIVCFYSSVVVAPCCASPTDRQATFACRLKTQATRCVKCLSRVSSLIIINRSSYGKATKPTRYKHCGWHNRLRQAKIDRTGYNVAAAANRHDARAKFVNTPTSQSCIVFLYKEVWWCCKICVSAMFFVIRVFIKNHKLSI